MKQTKRLLSIIMLTVFAFVSTFSSGVAFAQDGLSIENITVTLGEKEYGGIINSSDKTVTVYFDASATMLSELNAAGITIVANEDYTIAPEGDVYDLENPVTITFARGDDYTLTAVPATLGRNYDAEGACITDAGLPSDNSDNAIWKSDNLSGGAVEIVTEDGNSFVRADKNTASAYSLLSWHKTDVTSSEFSVSFDLRIAEITDAPNEEFASLEFSCVDQLLLSKRDMENGKFCFGHRTTEGKDQKILSDKGFDVGKWYNVNYTFKRLSEPTDDEISAKSYSGYICALYVDGELVDEFCHGIFTDWKITRTGRFTSHASYSQLGLRPYSKALVTIDIDNLTQYMCLGTEELKPEPDPEPDPDPEPEPDPEPDVPGVLEGSVDFGFEFNGEGWNTNLYNIITNGGFEEEDENGWKRGTTDMADVGYTTEKAYAGERSSYMFFPDVFPEGSKNTDNAYGAFRDYNVYSINPFSTYDISMAVIAEGISSDSRHNAQLSFRTSSASNGNKAVQGEEGGFCKITEDVSDWTVVRGRYTPSKEEEKYVTQLCTRMRGTNSTKGWFDEMYFGTMQRVVKESENGMSDSAFEGNGLMQIGAYNEMHGTESVYSDTLDCTANKTYLFTVYNKVDSDKANAYTAVEFLDENGNVISTVKSDSNTQTSWVKSELYATAPEGAAKLRMVLCASGSGLASFDSASLEEQTSVATSFVGIVPGKIGMPKNSEKKVELSGSVLDQFGAPMNSEISYKLASPVEGVSISGNIITITDRVEKGSIIKVTASADDLSETFEWYVESIRTFVINGADEIERDSKALEETYKAVLTNSEGTKTVLSPSETEWSVKNKKDGISIDSEGVLTVSKNAPVGTYTVIAKWLSDPEYVAEFDVKITRAPSGGSSGGFGGGFSGGSSFVPVNPAAPSQNPNPESQTQLPEASDKLYSDLDETHWAYNQIEEFTSKGIVTGKGNETFDPEGNVTRAEFVKILLLAIGSDVFYSDESIFADVSDESWYAPYVYTASKLGIVNGKTATTFCPDDFITRQEAATVIYRTLAASGVSTLGGGRIFADNSSIAAYAAESVSALSGAGIITGMEDGTFRPYDNTTRAQSVVILHRFVKILP